MGPVRSRIFLWLLSAFQGRRLVTGTPKVQPPEPASGRRLEMLLPIPTSSKEQIHSSLARRKIQCWNWNVVFLITAAWLLWVSWVTQPTCTLNLFIGNILPFSASSGFSHALLFGSYLLNMKMLHCRAASRWGSGTVAANAVFWHFIMCMYLTRVITAAGLPLALALGPQAETAC